MPASRISRIYELYQLRRENKLSELQRVILNLHEHWMSWDLYYTNLITQQKGIFVKQEEQEKRDFTASYTKKLSQEGIISFFKEFQDYKEIRPPELLIFFLEQDQAWWKFYFNQPESTLQAFIRKYKILQKVKRFKESKN